MERYGILSDAIDREAHDHYSGCRMCWAVSSAGQRFPVNQIILQNDTTVLIPGLGASTPGYVMLVSKNHVKSLATLSEEELVTIEKELWETIEFLEGYSKDWLVFEHGANNPEFKSGNTIDHLHIHLVPLDFDITSQAARRLGKDPVRVESLRDLRSAAGRNGGNYVYIKDATGESHAIFTEKCPSQFLRRITAEHMDLEVNWNWKLSPMEETSLATLRSFKEYGLIRPSIYFAHSIEGRETQEVERDIAYYRDLFARNNCEARLLSMYEVFEGKFFEKGYFKDVNLAGMLVETEKRHLEVSDLMLADLSIPGHQYVGALMEVIFAHDRGIPVVGVVGESSIGSRLWLEAHCRLITKDPDQAVQAANDLIGNQVFRNGALLESYVSGNVERNPCNLS